MKYRLHTKMEKPDYLENDKSSLSIQDRQGTTGSTGTTGTTGSTASQGIQGSIRLSTLILIDKIIKIWKL